MGVRFSQEAMSEHTLQQKLIAEFVGTFFLALTICTAAVHGSAGDYAPFAIAATLMVMIYGVGHISGAHFNPAVTVAVWLRGACEKDDVAPYIAVQIIAGAFAALASENILFAETSVTALEMDTTQAPVLSSSTPSRLSLLSSMSPLVKRPKVTDTMGLQSHLLFLLVH